MMPKTGEGEIFLLCLCLIGRPDGPAQLPDH